jgi:hypothetical protein
MRIEEVKEALNHGAAVVRVSVALPKKQVDPETCLLASRGNVSRDSEAVRPVLWGTPYDYWNRPPFNRAVSRLTKRHPGSECQVTQADVCAVGVVFRILRQDACVVVRLRFNLFPDLRIDIVSNDDSETTYFEYKATSSQSQHGSLLLRIV